MLGMVNQLGKFIPDLATVTDPLCALLKDKAAWLWVPAQDVLISRLKITGIIHVCKRLFYSEAVRYFTGNISHYGNVKPPFFSLNYLFI